MQKRKAVVLAALLAATVVVTAAATIYFTRIINNQVIIKATWGVSLWRMDAGYTNPAEMITAINWGQLDPGTSLTTNQLYGTCLKVRNDGNSLAYVAWELDPSTPLPAGVTLTASYDTGGGTWQNLPQNDFSYIYIQAGKFSGRESDPNEGRVEFKLSIDPYATPTSFSFSILLHAADSSRG